jgi:hypothetical protein
LGLALVLTLPVSYFVSHYGNVGGCGEQYTESGNNDNIAVDDPENTYNPPTCSPLLTHLQHTQNKSTHPRHQRCQPNAGQRQLKD